MVNDGHVNIVTKHVTLARLLGRPPAPSSLMEAFLISTGLVALAEIGDKTQLLALLLAARFRKPWPIFWGILAATLANHALAGGIGLLVARWLTDDVLRWVLGIGFLAMAAWMLIPDRLDDDTPSARSRWGVFGTTCVMFFLAEMGDKTQVATVALAARFQDWLAVVAGTTLGMMIANAPAVWLGDRMAHRLPVRAIHLGAAALLAALGLWALLGW